MAYRITDRFYDKPVLVAGFHRCEAYKREEIEEVEVDLRTGTWEEAWLAGWLSNLEQEGERYTNADKRKATENALKYFRRESNVAIAERIKVSDELVRKTREVLVRSGELESEIAVQGKDGRELKSKKNRSNKKATQVPTVGTWVAQESDSNLTPPTPPIIPPTPTEPQAPLPPAPVQVVEVSAIATEAEQRDKVEAVESEEDAGSPDISDLMAAWSQSVAVIWERATPEQRAVFVRWLSTQ